MQRREFHYNYIAMKNRRKQLRNQANESEQIMWTKLRKSQLGFKFTRQYSVDGYVMDFYCPKLRIGIEIDGGIHRSKLEYDAYRDKYIKSYDIKVIKFSDQEVINNIDVVIKKLCPLLK
jgi:very-short-patch-repair endonuclease